MTKQTIVRSWGNSQGIRLSKDILNTANIQVEDILQIEASENVIILRKIPKHKTFEERLAEYQGKISISDFDWGAPKGKEML